MHTKTGQYSMIYQDDASSFSAEIQGLKDENSLLIKRCEQYAQAYDLLREQIREMQRVIALAKSRSDTLILRAFNSIYLRIMPIYFPAQTPQVKRYPKKLSKFQLIREKRNKRTKRNCLVVSKLSRF